MRGIDLCPRPHPTHIADAFREHQVDRRRLEVVGLHGGVPLLDRDFRAGWVVAEFSDGFHALVAHQLRRNGEGGSTPQSKQYRARRVLRQRLMSRLGLISRDVGHLVGTVQP